MRGSKTARARELRRALTPQETRLWLPLRALRSEGHHFRRQAPVLGYFLDFVCFRQRLVVEVDGGQHNDPDQAAHDAIRDQVLRRVGLRTLRVSNGDINTNLDGVMRDILAALANPPSPLRGGTDAAGVRVGKWGDDPDSPTVRGQEGLEGGISGDSAGFGGTIR